MKNIFNLVSTAYIRYPKKIFLKSLNGKNDLNYEQTYNFILKLNKYFEEQKIFKQKKILVIFDNSILLSLLFLGITSTNRVFVPVNPEIGEHEFKHILKTSRPSYSLINKKFKNKFDKFFKKNSFEYIEDENFFISKIFTKDSLKFNTKFNGISEILFTSGSTGEPKGVVLTHKSTITNINGLEKSLRIKKFQNFLVITPIFHNNGQFIPTLMCKNNTFWLTG